MIDGYTFLMQNYNVGDSVCLFGSSGRDGDPDRRHSTDCDFVGRFLSWRIHCPSACGDVVQGIFRYHISILHLSLTPTLGWPCRSAYSRKITRSKYLSHTISTRPPVQVMKPLPGDSRRHSVALCPSILLVYGGYS